MCAAAHRTCDTLIAAAAAAAAAMSFEGKLRNGKRPPRTVPRLIRVNDTQVRGVSVCVCVGGGGRGALMCVWGGEGALMCVCVGGG